MTWNDALGNVSYVLFAFSYLVTNMLWLRLLAIVGLLTEAIYFYIAGSGSLWVAIGWSAVFLLINAVQSVRLVREMRSTRLSADEQVLKADTFAAMSLLSFRRLMQAGRWVTLPPGAVLTVQHTPVTHLRVLVRGLATVEADGKAVALVRAGGIVGEMSLLTGNAASATVTVTQEAHLFEVEVATLKQLLAKQDELRSEFHQTLGSELTAKLVALRERAVQALRA